MSDLGNKKIMAFNIKKQMKINNLTSKDVCEYLKIPAPTFSDWINAKTYPRIDKIEMLSNYFGVEKSSLVEDRSKMKMSVPVLGRVVAGIPIDAIEEIIDYEEITEKMANTGTFFALQIKGRSMEPRMKEGDVAIVREQPDIISGEVAIVLVNGDEATIKKVVKQENGIMLISFNEDYEPMFYSNEQITSLPIRILGKVVELRAKF